MKKGPRYKLPFKRRLEGKTDYRKRLKLLSSNELRLVVRKSVRHIRAQMVDFDSEGDKILVSASTQDLKKFGWEYETNNLPSAYLVGFLIGKRALKKKIKSAILDIGLHANVKCSKVYSVLKGALDAGLSVPHSEEILPSEDRIKGKHIVEYAKRLKKEKKYEKQFSKSKPEKIPETFEKVKSKMEKEL